uniref:O-methyltransferase C-terminal domain-containing protein n=1 Tax=Bionectria ochroleuca TaxID=29856 RepID=A0A8H7MYI0_BIOOC
MNCDDTDYEVLASQIESLLKRPDGALQIRDEKTRRRLVEGARKLAESLEFPRETYRRIQYSHLVLPLAVVGVDTGVFSALASENRPFCSTELAKKTGVDTQLLRRLLRYYQATDMISQVAVDTYQSSPVANVLSSDNHSDSLRFTLDKLDSQRVGSLYLSEAQSLGIETFPIAYDGSKGWEKSLMDAFDFKKHLNAQDISSSTFLFVDIGGGTGSQSLAFRKQYSKLPGRVALQDRPEVVERVKPMFANIENIEAEVYDFSTTPQPIRGARVYYMRNIFHAWADAKCVEILLNIKAGMTEQSVLMIDEIAIPETNAKGPGAQHDLEVMICVGGVERTEGQWASLLSGVGLIVHEIVKYDEDYEDALIIAGLA